MKRLWFIAIGMFVPLLVNAANVAIPPQPLGASLQDLAKQSGIQIIFFSKVVEGRQAPALNGTFTPEAALDKLLAGTDLTYHSLNDRTIEVALRPPATGVPWVPLPGPKPDTDAEAGPDAPIAEVEVTAERANLTELRAEIGKLERQFYSAYNRANTDRRYDVIVCYSITITGSHVDRRECRPAGLTVVPWLALAGEVRSVAAASVAIQTPTDSRELRAYQKNMVEVVSKHPELLQLIKQRNQLVERYRAALQERENRDFFGRR
jgi:hypothetical protein